MTTPRDSVELAVVTVTYRSAAVLPAFVDSLAGATSRPVHVVLADNAADAEVAAFAGARARLRIEYLDTGGNLGYGRAVNAGVAHTAAPWVVVANPDVQWTPGAIDVLLDAASRWPRGGAFGPRIDTPDGELYPSARDLPSLGRGIGHAVAGWWWPSNPWTAAYRREREDPRERSAGWLSGSCLLLRRVAFDAIGGFDPCYFMYFEDVDLGERLGDAGWKNVYVPTARVIHAQGHAVSRDRSTEGRMAGVHHDSAYRYLARRYPGVRWAPVRGALRAGLAARARLALRVRSVAKGAALQRREGG